MQITSGCIQEENICNRLGFTQDPTAILELKYSDGKYWIEELVYKRGLHNYDIYNFLIHLTGTRTEIIADSTEPKSIAEDFLIISA